MSTEQQPSQAISLDLDGVIIGKTTPLVKTLTRYVRHGSQIFEPPSPKSYEEIEEISEQALNPLERAYIAIVGRRRVSEDTARFIQRLETKDIYGNTGRPFKPAWVDITERTLQMGGVRKNFTNIFYRPLSLRVEESKARVIHKLLEKYDGVIHIDDNPAEALPLAKAFPQAKVFIIQSLTGGILFSANEAKNYPNVRRIASLSSLDVPALNRL